MSRAVIIGWTIVSAGIGLWLYANRITGSPPFIEWRPNTPWWIVAYLPNLQSEIGILLLLFGAALMFWPRRP